MELSVQKIVAGVTDIPILQPRLVTNISLRQTCGVVSTNELNDFMDVLYLQDRPRIRF